MSAYLGGFEVPAPPFESRPRGLLLDITASIDLERHPLGDEGDRDFDPQEKVIGGVHFCGGNACIPVYALPNLICEDVELASADEEFVWPDATQATFASFSVLTEEEAPTSIRREWLRERARQRLRVRWSAQIAYELLTGAETENPSLRNSTTIAVEGPTPIADLGYVLEDILARFEDVAFTVHTAPGVFSLMAENYLIEQDEGLDGEGNEEGDPTSRPFRTATGHVVVGDAGHDGSLGPVDPADPGTAEAPNYIDTASDGSWIYATVGRPLTWLGPESLIGEETANFNRETNKVYAVLERPAIVAFDPCAVVAIQVDVPTYDTVEVDEGSGSGS